MSVPQFLHQASLIVADANGSGLELSNLAFEFEVHHGVPETPNNAYFRIYNLSAQTARTIQAEFTQVTLRAGYAGNMGIIFQGTTTAIAQGNVRPIRMGRESPVDTYLDIFAADGDEPYNFGVVNTCLAAGYLPADVANAIAKGMGIPAGKFPPVQSGPAPRGKVLYGMARDYARDLAKQHGLDWGIHGGILEWLPQSAYKPGEAIVLSPETGLIGYPQQTDNGVVARCLLNPSIGIGSRIQISSQLVQSAAPDVSATATNTIPTIAADGIYKVLWVDFLGEMRGEAWYADVTALAVDSTVQPTTGASVSAVQGIGAPP